MSEKLYVKNPLFPMAGIAVSVFTFVFGLAIAKSPGVFFFLGGIWLLLALYITVSLYIERGREIAALQGEKSALLGKTSFLEAEIAKRDERALDADKRLCEIEKAAAAEKVRAAQAKEGGFDWDSPLPADAVTLQLRQD